MCSFITFNLRKICKNKSFCIFFSMNVKYGENKMSNERRICRNFLLTDINYDKEFFPTSVKFSQNCVHQDVIYDVLLEFRSTIMKQELSLKTNFE